jgi:C4-dicarboxylate-specific signal transduction histidine kinase
LRTAEILRQKEEMALQRDNVEQALLVLKATKDQLVQREKMASLGELTSGIAHEIKNPLNFVNNFAEVTGELVKEMNDQIEKGDIPDVKNIAAVLDTVEGD